ncbi:hypothetical protein CW705_02755 [Candidatus Bathyarchaeota archaeon]|nr:MAG: hypothetical protein CW705_02755 [Candidatus Bathyarchaeota archaeon]
MPKVPKGKAILYAYVDEVLLSKLRGLIRQKYEENIHGALSFEVEKAIEYYLQVADLHTNTHKPQDPTLPRTHRIAQQIIQVLRDRGFYNQVSINEVYKAISDIRGSDPRTKKKWLMFLVNRGYLEWVDNRVLKFSDAVHEADELFSKLREGGYVNECRSSRGSN